MANKLSLEILANSIGDGKITEFLVGEKQQLEKAGKMVTYHINGSEMITYTPFKTQRINSFHIRKDIYGNKTAKKLAPNEEIFLKEQDSIYWGYDEPITGIGCNSRNLN